VTSLPSDSDPRGSLLGGRRWQQSLLLSVRLRQAARLLLIFYASALVASALPLQPLNPRWYLNLTDVVMANAPIAITAASLALFSQVLSPLRRKTSWQVEKLRFQRFCALLALFYFALLPVQLIASGQFVQELNIAGRFRLRTLQNQQKTINDRLAKASSLAELNTLLPPQPGQASLSLAQRQAIIREALANDQRILHRQLSQERSQRLRSLVINGLRILLTALATAFFFRVLSRPSDKLLSRAINEMKTAKKASRG